MGKHRFIGDMLYCPHKKGAVLNVHTTGRKCSQCGEPLREEMTDIKEPPVTTKKEIFPNMGEIEAVKDHCFAG
jgi:hypothetical protein